MFKKIIILIISIELFLISILGYKIFYKKNTFGTQISIIPLNKESIRFNSINGLKYFYEPEPNKLVETDPQLSFPQKNIMNDDGLNNSANFSIVKPKKTFRIVTLGDSFTYGVFVATKDNWPEQLQGILNNKLKCRKIDKFEVINLGVSGYENVYSYERYIIRGKKYDPDTVIWFIQNGDFEKYNEVYIPISSRITKELIKSGSYSESVKNSTFYPYAEKTHEEMYKQYSPEEIFQLESKPFSEIRKVLSKPLIIAALPNLKTNYKDFLSEFVKNNKYSFFLRNMTNLYENSDYYFHNDGHPTEKGHQIIARDIFNYLVKNNIIPCN